MEIIRIEAGQVEDIVPLFDAYRQFYGQKSDMKSARKFLFERLSNSESIVFAAVDGGEIIGFVQIYPLFSSLGMRRVWVLNDLYVQEKFRRKGIAEKLVEKGSGGKCNFSPVRPEPVEGCTLFFKGLALCGSTSSPRTVIFHHSQKVHAFATESGARSIVLETATDNTKAQGLYKKLGYEKDAMQHYYFNLY